MLQQTLKQRIAILYLQRKQFSFFLITQFLLPLMRVNWSSYNFCNSAATERGTGNNRLFCHTDELINGLFAEIKDNSEIYVNTLVVKVKKLWNKLYNYNRLENSFISIYEKKLDLLSSDDIFEKLIYFFV